MPAGMIGDHQAMIAITANDPDHALTIRA